MEINDNAEKLQNIHASSCNVIDINGTIEKFMEINSICRNQINVAEHPAFFGNFFKDEY